MAFGNYYQILHTGQMMGIKLSKKFTHLAVLLFLPALTHTQCIALGLGILEIDDSSQITLNTAYKINPEDKVSFLSKDSNGKCCKVFSGDNFTKVGENENVSSTNFNAKIYLYKFNGKISNKYLQPKIFPAIIDKKKITPLNNNPYKFSINNKVYTIEDCYGTEGQNISLKYSKKVIR